MCKIFSGLVLDLSFEEFFLKLYQLFDADNLLIFGACLLEPDATITDPFVFYLLPVSIVGPEIFISVSD